MLNVNEIRNLERRWSRYRLRKNIRYFLFIFLLLLVFGGLYLLFFGKTVDKSRMQKSKNSDHKSASMKKHELDKSTSVLKNEILKRAERKTEILKEEKTSNTKKSIFGKTDKIYSENRSSKRDNFAKKEKKDNMLFLNKQFLYNIYNSSLSSKEINGSKKSLGKNEVPENRQKSISKSNKPKIVISSRKIDKINYYRKRFLDTKEAKYAIELSKIYFAKKEYKKSLRWAIISNGINSNNEESWILFAKNKVKMGEKDEAINALSVYLRVNSSKKVERLVKDIRKGIYK